MGNAWFEIRFKTTDNDACHGCQCIEPTPAPTHPPSYVGNFFAMSGDSCDVQGDCVSSGNYPSNHTNDEHCRITMLKDALVTPGAEFNLEIGYDHLTIEDEDIVTSDMIPGVLYEGQTFTWASDYSVTNPGWQLCFSESPDATQAPSETQAPATTGAPSETEAGIRSDLFDRYDENLDKELTLSDLLDMGLHMHIYDEILEGTDDNTLDLGDVESHTESYDAIWDAIVQTI